MFSLIDKSKLTQALTEKMIAASFAKNKADESSTEYLQANEQIAVLTEVIELVGNEALIVKQEAPEIKESSFEVNKLKLNSINLSLDTDVEVIGEIIGTTIQKTIDELAATRIKEKEKGYEKEIDRLIDSGQVGTALELLLN